MASAAVPSLSTDGWIKAINSKADYLLSYFFESQASQTTTFKGRIHSLSYIIATYMNDNISMESVIRDSLEELLLAYVDEVDVTVNVAPDKSSDDVSYNIYISAIISDNDETYNLSYLVGTSNSVISKVIKDIDGGTR